MSEIRKDQSAFSIVEGLLILVILGIIGFTGWYVWHAKQNTDKNFNSNTSAEPVIKKKTTNSPQADQTADWKSYTNTDGKYSLKYPNTWVTVSSNQGCLAGLLLVAPTANSLGSCTSKSNGEVSFIGVADSSHLCYNLDGTAFTNITKSTVVISGKTLTKQSGTTKDGTSGNGTLPTGTLEVTYCYGGSGQGFLAVYDQKPSDPSVLTDFNTIVTKTLKFN